eukprot:14455915-Alexandrium_andersonii.AAC.1
MTSIAHSTPIWSRRWQIWSCSMRGGAELHMLWHGCVSACAPPTGAFPATRRDRSAASEIGSVISRKCKIASCVRNLNCA